MTKHKNKTGIRKAISGLILLCFLTGQVWTPSMAHSQNLYLPTPGTMVSVSPVFEPLVLTGMKIYLDNPFKFDFILDQGNSQLDDQELKDQSIKLIKYFLASLTVPGQDMWVNLSPYEKNRIVPQAFGQTEMGRDLLAQDYLLKQITASLIYPEGETGKKFWKRVYGEAKKRFGVTDIAVDTFNKVWIVPEKAVVYENAEAGAAYVVESKLKVMLEEDYQALYNQKTAGLDAKISQTTQTTNAIGSQIVREIIIPELTKEINGGKNFAQLRQVYNSLILATWYKKKMKDSILSQIYNDKNKIAGVNIDDPDEKQKIYDRYLEAFQKGVYNYIKEEQDPATQEMIPKKYFSGGFSLNLNDKSSSPLTVTNQASSALLKKLSRTAGVLVIAASVVATSLYFHGKNLINSGNLGNAQSITQAMSNVQIRLDPVSEELLLDSQIFSDQYPKVKAEYSDHLRSYLFRFPVDKRHEIINALEELQKIQRSKEKVDPWAKLGLSSEFRQYPNSDADLFTLIEFLELGYLYEYQQRYMQSPLRLPGRTMMSSDEAKRIWEVFSGRKYNLREIIVDGFQNQGAFAKDVHHGMGSEKHWNVANFILSLSNAKIPLEAKYEYLQATQEAGYYTTPPVDAFERMYEEINKIEKSFWRSDAHKRQAMLFISDFYRYTGYGPVLDKIVEYYGGWNKFLTKIFQNPDLAVEMDEVRKDLIYLVDKFQGIEGKIVIPQFMLRWKLEDMNQFSKNFKALLGVETLLGTNAGQWGRFFINFDQAGFPITPDIPLQLMDPQKKVQILNDYLKSCQYLKNGTVQLSSREDYQALAAAWELFIAVGEEETISNKVQSITFVHRNNSGVLSYMFKQSAGVSPLFQQRMRAALKSIYDQIQPVPVGSYAEFVNAMNVLDFLKQFYTADADLYPKYLTYAKALVDSSAQWEDYIKQLPESEAGAFSTLMNMFREVDPARAGKLISTFVESQFPGFVQMGNMQDLSSIENIRARLNKISPILGDEFIITIARNFINTHPVTTDNIGSLLKVAKVWKYQAPNINSDVQELYKLVGYFIANNIYAYLMVNDVEGKANVVEELKGLGLIIPGADNSGVQTKINKLAINVAQMNTGYLLNKAAAKISSAGESSYNIEVADNNELQLPEAYTTQDVIQNGKKVGFLFVGDSQKGARVSVGFDVGFQNGGVSAVKFITANPNSQLVLDFPLGFTTGNGKPTDIAIEKGEVKNWLMSMDRAHGLVIVYQDGSMKIVDKRALQIKDLYLHPRENKYLDQRLDLRKLDDYIVFIDIAKSQKLSIAANMLLINDDEVLSINDGPDSRRILLQFSDGQIGVLNMNVRVSTAEATNVAAAIRLKNGVKVTRAIYADTGYYDYATVHTRNRGDIVLGHSDKPSSSNRIFFEQKEVEQKSSSSAATKGGIDFDEEKMNLQIENQRQGIKFNIDPAMLQQLQNAPGFTPIIINVQPMTNFQTFLGLKNNPPPDVVFPKS